MPDVPTQKTDATEGNEAEAPKEPVKSRRELAYEALIESREREKGNLPPAETNEPGPLEGEEEQPPAAAAPEPPMIEFINDNGEVVKVPATAKFRATVYGKQTEQTAEQLARDFQKGLAADQRFREADTRLKEADKRAADLARKEAELTEKEKKLAAKVQEAAKKNDEGDMSDADFQKIAKEFIDSLADEDEASMVSKVAKVFAGFQGKARPAPAIDTEALIAQAEERAFNRLKTVKEQEASERLEADRNTANEFFKTNYSDIINDPRLMGAARSETEAVMAEHPHYTQIEIAKEVGERIRKWSGDMKRPTPPPTPRAASTRASVGKDNPPPTRSGVLNEMRAARGQPTLS